MALGPLSSGFSTQLVDQVCWIAKTLGKLRTPGERGKHQSEALPTMDWLWGPAGISAVFEGKYSQLFCQIVYKNDEVFSLSALSKAQ